MSRAAMDMVERLGLEPHPEGGFYREVFRSPVRVACADGRERSASTAIYFLLAGGQFSAWHRVLSDELWHLYAGQALDLWMMCPQTGAVQQHRLSPSGSDTYAVAVPAGWWQAAVCPQDQDFALMGCTVAPGFEFSDFELAGREQLIAAYPGSREAILRFTRG